MARSHGNADRSPRVVQVDYDADADAVRVASEAPSFKAGGRVYRGRVLSVLEYQAFAPQIAMMDAGVLTDGETVALMREFVEAMFPAPEPQYSRHWFGLVRRPIPQLAPADVFFALSFDQQLEGVKNFVRCLVSALPAPGNTMPSPIGSDVDRPGGEVPRPHSGLS